MTPLLIFTVVTVLDDEACYNGSDRVVETLRKLTAIHPKPDNFRPPNPSPRYILLRIKDDRNTHKDRYYGKKL